MVLKTYALAAADRGAMRELYQAEAALRRGRLADYSSELETAAARGDDDPHSLRFGAYATLQLGIAAERTMIDWCDWVVGKLRR